MSRHRNVRSMRYSDEYDGYDDVYSHSVEEEYPMSPSDAAFFYDRNNRQTQLSSFIQSEGIEEEEMETPPDEKLQPCLIALRGVVGNEKPDSELIPLIVEVNYDVELALNRLYSKDDNPSEVAPKPQRKTADRPRGRKVKKKEKLAQPHFNVLQFLKTKIDVQVDSLEASLLESRSSRAPQQLLSSRLSTIGYYLCKKSVEKDTPPRLVTTATTVVDRSSNEIPVERFKFDVHSPDDAPTIRRT